MGRHLARAANAVVPANLAIESLGYVIAAAGEGLSVRRGDDELNAADPVVLLGLIRLVEMRSWDWQATDCEIDKVLARFGWH